MKKLIITSIFGLFGIVIVNAQTANNNITLRNTLSLKPTIYPSDSTNSTTNNHETQSIQTNNGEPIDSLHTPEMDRQGHVMSVNSYPYYYGGWNSWALHQGLNVRLDASVFGSFGKNAPHGAGFSQSLSAMYVAPLTGKLSLAVGGYLDNMTWSGANYRSGGLSAVLDYRFNEHWEAAVYVQKSLVNKYNLPYRFYGTNNFGDRIGAMVRYSPSPNFSFQVSVERNWMPNQSNQYFDQYNYPLPKP